MCSKFLQCFERVGRYQEAQILLGEFRPDLLIGNQETFNSFFDERRDIIMPVVPGSSDRNKQRIGRRLQVAAVGEEMMNGVVGSPKEPAPGDLCDLLKPVHG